MDDLTYLNSSLTSSSTGSQPLPPADGTTNLDRDAASLQNLLATLQTASEDDDLDEASISDLLRQLGQADVAADALENRVDSLLESLDTMLDGLKSDVPTSSTAETVGVASKVPLDDRIPQCVRRALL
jgi:hypothetical protein